MSESCCCPSTKKPSSCCPEASCGTAPVEQLKTDSVCTVLTSPARHLRRTLINRIVDEKGPLKAASLPDASTEEGRLLEELSLRQRIVRNAQGDILFIYPVSAQPTCHRVTLQDGRKFSAMCAVDALGSTCTFGQDTAIDSKCSHCGQPIHAEVKSGRLHNLSPGSTHVLHVDLSSKQNWAGSS